MRSGEVRRGRKIGGDDKRIADTPSRSKGDEKEQAQKKRKRTHAKREQGKRREK